MMTTEELESYMTIPEECLQIAYRNIRKIADSCEDYDLKKPLKSLIHSSLTKVSAVIR